MKRPTNVSKKLWRKASKKEREFIIWHQYLHQVYRAEALNAQRKSDPPR